MASVYTVAQVTSYISHLFEEDFALKRISIQGEISNCKKHTSGHLYFTLKDAESTLSCVMFARERAKLTFSPAEGMRVIAKGSVRVYGRDGVYQLYVTELEVAGVGEWFRLFEERKAEFLEMGMFADEYKKPIPQFAKTVGIVTARTGAAIQDIINISHRRNPYVQLILYPTLVQGSSAAEQIARGIDYLDTLGLDVIIVGRGGGSIEDLWAFNEECVAMAIFRCETPIISAVGHETDFTIADFVADLRAPTPSAAAELAVFEFDAFEHMLSAYLSQMSYQIHTAVEKELEKLEKAKLLLKLSHPSVRLQTQSERLQQYASQMQKRIEELLLQKKSELAVAAAKLEAQSPMRKLSGGYAFLTDEQGSAVNSVNQLSEGSEFLAYLKDGIVKGIVKEIEQETEQVAKKRQATVDATIEEAAFDGEKEKTDNGHDKTSRRSNKKS